MATPTSTERGSEERVVTPAITTATTAIVHGEVGDHVITIPAPEDHSDERNSSSALWIANSNPPVRADPYLVRDVVRYLMRKNSR